MWVCIPGQDSWVLLIPAGFLEEGFLGLRKHEQLQHFCAAGADVKGGNFIQLRSHNIMEQPEISGRFLQSRSRDMSARVQAGCLCRRLRMYQLVSCSRGILRRSKTGHKMQQMWTEVAVGFGFAFFSYDGDRLAVVTFILVAHSSSSVRTAVKVC